MKQIYSKSSLTLGTKFLSNTIKTLLILFSLLAFTGNAWATLTGKTAVPKGKGTATVEIYKYSLFGDTKNDSKSSNSSAEVYVSASTSNTTWRYCKFIASAATGYTFDAWYTNTACTTGKKTDSSFQTSNQKKGDRTDAYYAKFTPNKYDVTLAPNGGSGSNQTITATYDAAMPTTLKAGGAIVKPSKTGYTFAGYYDATSGGNQYYTKDLTSARTWDKASTGVTLYARWTPNKYTITLNAGEGTTTAGTTSIAVTFDAYTNLTSAITTPTKSGKVFDGYYTGANGSGTQIIDEFGNIIASAGGGSTYTDADKKWKYAGSIDLQIHSVDDRSKSIDDGRWRTDKRVYF